MRFVGDRGNGPFGQGPGGLELVPNDRTYSGGIGGIPAGGMPQAGMPPTGVPPAGVPPTGMPYSGMLGPSPGGSIRNNLGSELKKRGVFQKDGQIQNSRGGFFGAKPQKSGFNPGGPPPMGTVGGVPGAQGTTNTGGGNMGTGPFSFLGSGGAPGGPGMPLAQARQLILEPAQAGIAANGVATISPDNVFTCIANLPSPNTLISQGYGTYAAYLVDEKGQTGFLAGILRPVGNGAYQTQFRSQVPLAHYSRVIITIENAQQLSHVPRGPIVLQVKQPAGPIRFLSPVKKAGSSVWKKVTGLFQGKPKAPIPEGGGVPLEVPPPTPVELPIGNPPIGTPPVEP